LRNSQARPAVVYATSGRYPEVAAAMRAQTQKYGWDARDRAYPVGRLPVESVVDELRTAGVDALFFVGPAGDLQELLTSIIAIIVSEMPSEEGSILLYNEESDQLEFFSAMGETGESFIQCAFPADKGVAGRALQEGAPIIVNDTQTCPFFFKNFDDNSGFVTRSILAAPIIVGEEKVGVIEAINKVGSNCFDETDKRMLIAIADEVGLAVKNARMFDYVVNSYCKLRQGLSSCKGCERPLRTWTPCARQLDLL
jgi:transcriptional regulator with GAF, ATPase, and Fis domain